MQNQTATAKPAQTTVTTTRPQSSITSSTTLAKERQRLRAKLRARRRKNGLAVKSLSSAVHYHGKDSGAGKRRQSSRCLPKDVPSSRLHGALLLSRSFFLLFITDLASWIFLSTYLYGVYIGACLY